MKSILIAMIVLFSALMTLESSAASNADGGIKQVFGQLDRCLADDDASCIGDLFVEDGTFSEPRSGAKLIKGKAQIVKTLQGLLMAKDAPTMKGVKRTHTVENVRMIGEDHAVVDCSMTVSGLKSEDGKGPAAGGSFHAVALMIRNGSKWQLQDLRSYIVEAEPSKEPKAEASKEPTTTATPLGK